MARKPRDPELLREYLDALLSHFAEEELEPLRAEAARLKMSMHRIAERNLRRAGIFDFDWYCGWKQARAEANRQVVRALRAGEKNEKPAPRAHAKTASSRNLFKNNELRIFLDENVVSEKDRKVPERYRKRSGEVAEKDRGGSGKGPGGSGEHSPIG